MGKWSALDTIVSFVVGSSLSRALTGSADLVGTLLAMTLLLALHWAFARLAAISPRVSRILEGPPVILGRDGKLDAALVARHAVSSADLDEGLRAARLEGPEQASLVVLEPSGKISALGPKPS